MATIQSTLALQDKMSRPMSAVAKTMNSTLTAMRSIKGAELGPEFAAAAADVQRAQSAVEQMNQALEETPAATRSAADGFTMMKGLAVNAISSIANEVKNLVADIPKIADEITSLNARMNYMTGNQQLTAELWEKIYGSARRSRGAYLDVANAAMSVYTRTGETFSNIEEALYFTELWNKAAAGLGRSAAETQAAFEQVLQGMSLGVIQGQDLKSAMSYMPEVFGDVAKQIGISVGELRSWAADGLLTAEVFKEAFYASADAIEARLAAMPMTIGQIGQNVSNVLLRAFMPMLQAVGKGAQYVHQNWEGIAPVVWGVTAAIGAYVLMTKAAAIAESFHMGMIAAHNVLLFAQGVAMVAVGLATGQAAMAQQGLNIAMAAAPMGLTAIGIGVIVGLIYKWVQSVGGLEIAWIKVMDGIYNAGSWVWEQLALSFEGFLNFFIEGYNDIVRLVNLIPGIERDLAEQATFGVKIAYEQETNRAVRALESELKIRDILASQAEQAAGFNLDDFAVSTVGGKALKTTGEVKIDGEDLKMLLDISTMGFRMTYEHIAPTISMNGVVIHETADMDAVMDVVADRIAEAAESRLVTA